MIMAIIVGIVMLFVGTTIGVFVEAMMVAAHDEDERMQQGARKNGKGEDRRDIQMGGQEEE